SLPQGQSYRKDFLEILSKYVHRGRYPSIENSICALNRDRVSQDRSTAEVEELDGVDGLAEESAAEIAELLYGISGIEVALPWRRCRCCCVQGGSDLRSSGFGGVDDSDGRRKPAFDIGAEQRVVGAAEDERVGIEAGAAGVLEKFAEVSVDDLLGDGVVDPALFNQWYEEWAGFFEGSQAAVAAGGGVGVAFHGGGRGDDQDVSGLGRGLGGVGSRFDDSEGGDGYGGADLVEGEGGGGIAGDDQILGPLLNQEARAGHSVAGDGGLRFGSVGKPRGVTEVEVIGGGQPTEQGAKHGEAAEAGIENADV